MAKIIKIVKKTTTTITPIYKTENLHVFKTLQHFGFKHYEKTDVSALEKKLLTKYKQNENYLLQSLGLIKKALAKEFVAQSSPFNVAYPLGNDEYNFHIIGTNKNIYDALAIEACYSVLEEILGNKNNLLLEICFVGDKESINNFNKELNQFFKKNIKAFSKITLAAYKKDLYQAYKTLEGNNTLNVPSPIDHLSEISRIEFKEILEYIEALNMNYVINPFLIEDANICSGFVFRIKSTDEKKSYLEAVGGRYDVMGKKLLSKKEFPIISACIKGLSKIPKVPKTVKLFEDDDIKFFYAQLGPEARFKTLKIMDIMRSASIPMHHALSKDKISAQIAHAEKLGVPYLLLVGHREAIQNAVLVRNMKNLSQENVPIDELVNYIKNLLS